jgi:hypothetical protein
MSFLVDVFMELQTGRYTGFMHAAHQVASLANPGVLLDELEPETDSLLPQRDRIPNSLQPEVHAPPLASPPLTLSTSLTNPQERLQQVVNYVDLVLLMRRRESG